MPNKILALLAFLIIAPVSVFAQSSTTTPQAITVANVNLKNCAFTQEVSTGLITVVCDINNVLGNQGDIRYGVQLLQNIGSVQTVVDTKVYEDVLSLRENQTIQKGITYNPPSYLSGTYKILAILKTSAGLPLATYQVASVTLKGSAPYFEIKADTCTLSVSGTSTKYKLAQRIILNPDDTLVGSCSVVSHNTGNMDVTPSLVAYEGSIFGKAFPITTKQESVGFTNNSTKTVSFSIPVGDVPQTYDAILSIASPNEIQSNTATISYLVKGASVSILNVLFDKDRYSAGDTANISAFWRGTVSSVAISILDENNNTCAKETTFPSPSSEAYLNNFPSFSLPISRNCVNPQATIKLLDVNGAVLASKIIGIESAQATSTSPFADFFNQTFVLYGLVILSVMIAITAFMFIKKPKSPVLQMPLVPPVPPTPPTTPVV